MGTPRPVKPAVQLRPSRGLSRGEAAAYCGLSEEAFDLQVEARIFPAPLPLVGRRKVWDIKAIDRAFDVLSGLASDDRREDRKAEALRRSFARP